MSKDDIKKAGVALFDKVKELSESYDVMLTPMLRYEASIPYCRGLLESFGFRVVPPITYKYDHINDINGLIDFFYSTFNYLYPKEITPTRTHTLDLKIIDGLLSKLMEGGNLTRKQAIKEVAQIIEVVLNNPDRFKSVLSIGLRVFTQDKMSWVTETALAFINDRRFYQTSDYFDKLNELCNETYEGEVGFNLDEIEENDNGKKETTG